MAMRMGAAPKGNWSGCHSVGWDLNAPDYGDLGVGNKYQRHSYPFSIMVNANGMRFLDEGSDIRTNTYAKYGREVLAQPGQFAWQVYDAKTMPLLETRDYHIKQSTKVTADSIEELAEKMEGVDARRFVQTVEEYNAAVDETRPFNPALLDGRRSNALPPKSNWAQKIDTPPYEAYAVTCGITFTYGGLSVDEHAQVLDRNNDPIPGLYAAGEMVGGVFYGNYMGATGLMSGLTMGRIAGKSSAPC
jgi:tricarballylate dehydrogenase